MFCLYMTSSFCFQVFPDKFAGREILDFVVYCVNFPDGCKWRGELRNLEVYILFYFEIIDYIH